MSWQMWLPMSYSTCQCINIYILYIYIYYIHIYIYIYISLHSHLETDSTVTAIQQWDKIRSYLPADVCTRWKHHVQSWITGRDSSQGQGFKFMLFHSSWTQTMKARGSAVLSTGEVSVSYSSYCLDRTESAFYRNIILVTWRWSSAFVMI